MPTNPGNIVRIRSRNGGRASVYESNMWAQKFTVGLFSGSGVRQNTSADMNILVGGLSTNPDVVIGKNAAGYNIALDIVGAQTIAITKPAANSRIAAIVAYTNDLSLTSTDAGTTGSPSSCGLIVVNGASSASPVAPSDSDIRAAITADGATGSQATYCVIATILVASTTTTITNTLITMQKSLITSDKIDLATFIIGAETVIGSNGTKPVYRKTLIGVMNVTAATINIPHGITSLDTMISIDASVDLNGVGTFNVMPWVESTQRCALSYNATNIIFGSSFAWGSNRPYRIDMVYTKT